MSVSLFLSVIFPVPFLRRSLLRAYLAASEPLLFAVSVLVSASALPAVAAKASDSAQAVAVCEMTYRGMSCSSQMH